MTKMPLETVLARDGFRLSVRHYAPTDPWLPCAPRAAVIIASAMGVKQEFYAPFAVWLAQQGVAVYTFDYRGMGASMPEDGSLDGFAASIEDWATLDCAAVIDAAAARYPKVPMAWLGHSVGAQMLGLIPNRDRVDAMLSVAAGSGYWRYNARPLRYYALLMWHVIVPFALRVSGYFPGKRLRIVGDLPRGVTEQWRKWCLSADYVGAEGEGVRAGFEELTIPITALSMQDDEMMTLRGTRALFDLYRNAAVDVRRLRPRELGLRRIGHFGFFRAPMEDSLWPMVTAWLDEIAAPRTQQTAQGAQA